MENWAKMGYKIGTEIKEKIGRKWVKSIIRSP